MPTHSGLIGRAGEMLVAAELMRQGVEVAAPYTDRGVDLIAYRLNRVMTLPNRLVTIQVKSASQFRFSFQKSWLKKVASLVLVWKLDPKFTPEYYVFSDIEQIECALGEPYISSASWTEGGVYSNSNPSSVAL